MFSLNLISNPIDYTIWGFWITILGTTLSLISLFLTISVKFETKNIKGAIRKDLMKQEIKKAKGSIIKDIITCMELIKEDDTIDYVLIKTTLNSINLYEAALSKKSKKIIQKIEKRLRLFNIKPGEKLGKFFFKKDFIVYLDQLYKRIESEIDQKEEYIRRLK